SATTDSMYQYDISVGPKPVDQPADPVMPPLHGAPQGLAWMPNHLTPFSGDPLYPDILEHTFDLWQDYSITPRGWWAPAAWIAGEMVINRFAAPLQPRIVGVSLIAGGTLSGPQTVYAAVTQHNPAIVTPFTSPGPTQDGYSVPSNQVAVWI